MARYAQDRSESLGSYNYICHAPFRTPCKDTVGANASKLGSSVRFIWNHVVE